MDRARAAHGQQMPHMSCPDMGTRREKQERNTKRNAEKDCGATENGNGFQLLA